MIVFELALTRPHHHAVLSPEHLAQTLYQRIAAARRSTGCDKKLKENIVPRFSSPRRVSSAFSLLIPANPLRSTTASEIFVGLLPRTRDWNTFKYLTGSSLALLLFLHLRDAMSLSLNPPGD